MKQPSFCGVCIEDRQDLVQRPIGRNDGMVWICEQCDKEVVRERDHLFGGKGGGTPESRLGPTKSGARRVK